MKIGNIHLEKGQILEHVGGLIYEIKNKDGTRDRVVNALVDDAMIENKSLRYLRHYQRTLYRIQRLRIAAGNGKSALERMGLSADEQLWMQENIDNALNRLENRLERRCAYHLKAFPIWTDYLSRISGVGPRLGSSLISIIATPKRFENNTALYKYAGLASIDGEIQKRRKGQKSEWSSELKTTLYKLSDSFIKVGRGYRDLYDQFKKRENLINQGREKPLTKGHIDMRTRRRVLKLFLSHLLQRWRELEGLPVRKPYPIEYLGHKTLIEPFTDQ